MKKKIIFTIILLFSFLTSFAQIQWYRATSFAMANVYNGRYVWGDWEKSNVNICFNLGTDVITIYSPRTQTYRIYGTYNNGKAYSDNSGGRNVKFYVIDQDYDKGELRLRVESNGNSQIYIDFNNIAFVYNVVRTQ